KKRQISLLLLVILYFTTRGTEVIRQTVTHGWEVTLPCRAEGYMPLELMEWSRPGTHLQYVVIFRTQSQDLEIPEQRYEGRVELKDKENGDVSLVLKNVTAEDGGTYQCYVKRDTDQTPQIHDSALQKKKKKPKKPLRELFKLHPGEKSY
uniref:Ig-like domain-containing protein n=1 Tax=Cyprinodon variegatus TaxID=28743 RepID=A0A3Q2CUH8_CYPVA